MNNLRLLAALLGMFCFAPLVLAHPGHLDHGLADGFFHSFSAFDYVVLVFAGGGLWLLLN